jgi:KDO2-lipid IV(A) lauroyltransferase
MYYVVYGLLYLLSLLPMWVLYLLSDSLAFFLYYVIRYRRDIVLSNLAIAFPEKPEKERARIAWQFYSNFVDNFIETLKLVSASRSFISKHFVIDNPGLLEEYYRSGRKCQLHLGHIFNWEIANIAMPFYTSYTFIVVYMPIGNRVFNRISMRQRSRTGTVLLPATNMSKAIIPYRNSQYMLTLVADQAPGNYDKSYWLNFFGRPTPFVKGPERGARIADIPVVFVRLYKTRRGYYRAHLTRGADHPAQLPEGELTLRYARFLEDAIRQEPASWLWSHKRWKNEWKEEYRRLRVD